MRKTTVVNVNKDEHYDEYIGRGSQWGNPFKIGKDGTRKEVIKKYEEWIVKEEWLMEDIPSLKGKVLGCHCKPKPCHGDVLVKLADGEDNDENVPEVWHFGGNWYIKHEGNDICMNEEETARMLLRLLKRREI